MRFFKQLAIVKFKGIDNINDIERYKGCSLYVTREDAIPLEEDEYYIADLQGMQMYTALVDRGVPARLCYFRGENHELSRSGKPQHRIRRLKEITDWFENHREK